MRCFTFSASDELAERLLACKADFNKSIACIIREGLEMVLPEVITEDAISDFMTRKWDDDDEPYTLPAIEPEPIIEPEPLIEPEPIPVVEPVTAAKEDKFWLRMDYTDMYAVCNNKWHQYDDELKDYFYEIYPKRNEDDPFTWLLRPEVLHAFKNWETTTHKQWDKLMWTVNGMTVDELRVIDDMISYRWFIEQPWQPEKGLTKKKLQMYKELGAPCTPETINGLKKHTVPFLNITHEFMPNYKDNPTEKAPEPPTYEWHDMYKNW